MTKKYIQFAGLVVLMLIAAASQAMTIKIGKVTLNAGLPTEHEAPYSRTKWTAEEVEDWPFYYSYTEFKNSFDVTEMYYLEVATFYTAADFPANQQTTTLVWAPAGTHWKVVGDGHLWKWGAGWTTKIGPEKFKERGVQL